MYNGIIKKSRTLDVAALLAMLGVVQQALPSVQTQLGDYYGLVFMGVGAIVAYLRTTTTGPVGAKSDG